MSLTVRVKPITCLPTDDGANALSNFFNRHYDSLRLVISWFDDDTAKTSSGISSFLFDQKADRLIKHNYWVCPQSKLSGTWFRANVASGTKKARTRPFLTTLRFSFFSLGFRVFVRLFVVTTQTQKPLVEATTYKANAFSLLNNRTFVSTADRPRTVATPVVKTPPSYLPLAVSATRSAISAPAKSFPKALPSFPARRQVIVSPAFDVLLQRLLSATTKQVGLTGLIS